MTLTMKLDEARTEGIAEGRAEGAAEQNVTVAQRLIAMGFSAVQISEATGLSLQEVEKLRNDSIGV